MENMRYIAIQFNRTVVVVECTLFFKESRIGISKTMSSDVSQVHASKSVRLVLVVRLKCAHTGPSMLKVVVDKFNVLDQTVLWCARSCV